MTGRRLLEAGKSAFVEKPMGLNAGECKALAELAASRGLRLGVNHNFLFTPGYEAMRRDAASGALGMLDHLSVNWLYALGLIQSTTGSSSESNLLYELIAAFATDLLGCSTRAAAVASQPIKLPGSSARLSPLERHWAERRHLEPEPVGRSGAA